MDWLKDEMAKVIQQPDTIETFGIILFTERHANVQKLLRDNDYWKSLNSRSGDKWAIFATQIAQGEMEYPTFPAGTIGFMVRVWKEPEENKSILDIFNLKETRDAPCLVIFTQFTDGEIFMNSAKIDDSSVDSVYLSLGSAIDSVAEGIANVRQENLKNQEGIFTAMNYALESHNQWQLIKKRVPLGQWIASLIV